jgi:DNA mismatch repair protein MutL
MSRIRVLPEDLMNKIAAGEVVERPASIVKELVENAVDAGADRIDVTVAEGGRKLIRVADNGSGMSAADARLAFARHATSKIATSEDLVKIETLGFRGEALPSIASVAQVTLKTKEPRAVAGTMIKIAGGEMASPQATGAAPGTVIEAKNIFYNTPARRKYLKSVNTEYGHIAAAVTDQALAHSAIGFTLTHNDRQTLAVPPGQKTPDRIRSLFGKDLATNLVPLRYRSPYLEITGYVGKPAVARSSRDQQYLFINNRRVENRLLAKAAWTGYHTLLQKQEYPVYFMFLRIRPDLVDVNVHPQKKEVRFLNQNMVFTAVRETVKAALEKTELAPRVDLGGRVVSSPVTGTFSTSARLDSPLSQKSFTVGSRAPGVGAARNFVKELLTEESVTAPAYKIFGQLARTYIVGEDAAGLFLIDQHAAHERELFDKFSKVAQRATATVSSQKLLTPVRLELTARAAGVLSENFKSLTSFGLAVEPWGGGTNTKMFSVTAVPADLINIDVKDFVNGVIDDLTESSDLKKAKNIREKITATMACRGAVKAGADLAYEEMKRLVDLVRSGAIKTCPHGRPVQIKLSREELEKQFGRKR